MSQLTVRPAPIQTAIPGVSHRSFRRGASAACVAAALIAAGGYAASELVLPDTSAPGTAQVPSDAGVRSLRDSLAAQYGGAVSVAPVPNGVAVRSLRDSVAAQYGGALSVKHLPTGVAIKSMHDSLAALHGGSTSVRVVPRGRALREARGSAAGQYGGRVRAGRGGREPSTAELRQIRDGLARQYGVR